MNASPAQDSIHLRSQDWLFAGILFALFLVVYLSMLLPGLGYHPDTIKYQFIGKVLGLSHPPGSPLYILINFIAAQFPIGELAWRINALSALFGAASIGLLYLVLRRFAAGRLAAISASLLFATSQIFWSQSLVAEVYTPHLFMVLLSLWFFAGWDSSGSLPRFIAGCICFGLSFGIHTMSILFAPGLALYLFLSRHRTMGLLRWFTGAAAFALSAVLPYLYYAIRPVFNPVYAEEPIRSAGEFLRFISGGYFTGNMFAYGPGEMLGERLGWAIEHWLMSYGLVVLIAAAAGLLLLFFLSWKKATFAAITCFLSAVYAMGYKVGDAEIFLLPSLLMLAAGAGAAIHAIGLLFSSRFKVGSSGMLAATLLSVVLLGSQMLSLPVRYKTLDMSASTRLHALSAEMIGAVDENALIVSSDQWNFLALFYHIHGSDMRAGDGIGITSIRSGDCGHLREIIDREAAARPLYFTADMSDCLAELQANVLVTDQSYSLTEYLDSLPAETLVLMAIFDEGTAGLDAAARKQLSERGLVKLAASGYRWSYAGVFVKVDGQFRGSELTGQDAVHISLKSGEPVNGYPLPMNVSITSGGALSATAHEILAGGLDYARPLRGLHIVCFDVNTGAPAGRQTVDTHRGTSLADRYYFKLQR